MNKHFPVDDSTVRDWCNTPTLKFNCIPQKLNSIAFCLRKSKPMPYLPQQPDDSSKLVSDTPRRPKCPPLRYYPNKQIYLSVEFVIHWYLGTLLIHVWSSWIIDVWSSWLIYVWSSWLNLVWSLQSSTYVDTAKSWLSWWWHKVLAYLPRLVLHVWLDTRDKNWHGWRLRKDSSPWLETLYSHTHRFKAAYQRNDLFFLSRREFCLRKHFC